MDIDVITEDARWEQLGLADLAACAVTATLGHLQVDGDVVVMGCDDDRISALNADFRGKPTPTNVLSWPSEERGAAQDGDLPGGPNDPELGDIAIAYDTCEREARDQRKTMAAHTTHLLVHGTLHLLGYDHERDADAALMEAVEIAILATLDLPNPYLDPTEVPAQT